MNVCVKRASLSGDFKSVTQVLFLDPEALLFSKHLSPRLTSPSSVGKYLRHSATWQHVGAEVSC